MHRYLNVVKNPTVKKTFSVVSVIFTGVVAVSGALEEQQREREFRQLKRKVSELQKKIQ